jgi:hypothetical protein
VIGGFPRLFNDVNLFGGRGPAKAGKNRPANISFKWVFRPGVTCLSRKRRRRKTKNKGAESAFCKNS